MDGEHKKPEPTEPATGWQYTPQEGASNTATPQSVKNQPAAVASSEGIEWTASEFAAHHKSAAWYIGFAAIAVVISAAVFIITRDVFSVFIIATLAVVIGLVGARKPRVIAYRIDRSGITTGSRFHPYSDYRSFTVIDEGPFLSLDFTPSKRFMPPLSVYLSPEDEDKIITLLATYLPMRPGNGSGFDSFLRQVRF